MSETSNPPSDYSKKSGKELKTLCKEKGLKYSDTKADMIKRLIAYDNPLPETIVKKPTLAEVQVLWTILLPIIKAKGPLLFLGQVLLKKEHGKRPGGMGTGSAEEDLWTTQFAKCNILCNLICNQADCGIICNENQIPLSIKCTQSGFAVCWSKNPIFKEFNFIAPIMIIWHKPNESGIYIVDPDWCQQNVTFTKNNKTDYVVDGKIVVKMLKHAKDNGLFEPITPLADNETHFIFRNPHLRTTEMRLLSDLKPTSP